MPRNIRPEEGERQYLPPGEVLIAFCRACNEVGPAVHVVEHEQITNLVCPQCGAHECSVHFYRHAGAATMVPRRAEAPSEGRVPFKTPAPSTKRTKKKGPKK
jgi:hypothetical protein